MVLTVTWQINGVGNSLEINGTEFEDINKFICQRTKILWYKYRIFYNRNIIFLGIEVMNKETEAKIIKGKITSAALSKLVK